MVIVAKFLRPYGYDGKIKIKVLLSNSKNIKNFSDFYTDKNIRLKIDFISKSKNIYICKVENFKNSEQVKELTNQYLYLKEIDLPKLNKNQYYFFELEDLDVKMYDKKIGRILSVNNHGAGDYFEIEVKKNKKKILAPNNKDHIIEININKKYIVLNSKYYQNEI